MTRTGRTSPVALAAAALMLLLAPANATAQFETPNRSFHDATSFRLDGKHQAVACESCHIKGQYPGTPRACFDCHWIRRKDDRYQTRLGAQCDQCHRPTSWTAVRWDHGAQAGVPLNLDHKTLPCVSCHRSAEFKAATVTCIGCHQKDYAASQAPNHAAAGFPTTCEACHRPNDATWRNTGTGAFSHNSVFPLVGLHATQTCATCHKNNVYKGTPRDCVGCHRDEYNRTQNPNHVAAGFPLSCEGCHRPTDPSFRGAGTTFNHALVFALVGTHATQTCVACHKNNVFKGTPRDCIGCHQEKYNRTQSPNHLAAGFSTDCSSCHRPTDPSWGSGGGFNHNSVFALVGVHATQGCATCHKNNVFKGTPRECVGCHDSDYTRAQNPNHVSAGFPRTCDSCHKPTDPTWSSGGGFNHASVFALVGTHASQACAKCHVNNVYRGTPRTCVGCHQPQYNATRNPNHAAAGFPTTCDSCHRATDPTWASGGGFNHNAAFALVGVHATQACTTCHVNNVYRGTPRTCAGCHQPQYNATRNPNHAAAGFPTTCETCHRATDSLWTQGTFAHTRFPLTSRHNVPCAQCHTTPNNFQVFSCTVCHARPQMDDKHRGRAGYIYESNACYTCHPNGRAG